MRIRSLFTTGFLLFTAAGLRAQQGNQEPIPRALVAEILRNPPSTMAPSAEPDFLIGRAPGGLADRLPVPNGARVLGTLLTQRDTEIYIVLDQPARTDSLEEWIRNELPRHGWRPGRNFGGAPPRGGFVMAASIIPSNFCDSTATEPASDARTVRFRARALSVIAARLDVQCAECYAGGDRRSGAPRSGDPPADSRAPARCGELRRSRVQPNGQQLDAYRRRHSVGPESR